MLIIMNGKIREVDKWIGQLYSNSGLARAATSEEELAFEKTKNNEIKEQTMARHTAEVTWYEEDGDNTRDGIFSTREEAVKFVNKWGASCYGSSRCWINNMEVNSSGFPMYTTDRRYSIEDVTRSVFGDVPIRKDSNGTTHIYLDRD